MCFYILTGNGSVIVRDSVSSLDEEETRRDDMKHRIREFDDYINNKFGDRKSKSSEQELDREMLREEGITPEVDESIFGAEALEWDQDEPEAAMPEVDDYTPDSVDTYLRAEVVIPRGGTLERGTVVRRAHGPDQRPIGKRNDNPILDTRSYEVQFEDGDISTYQANMIAEHMYSQCDSEGHELMLMDEIIDHRSTGDAVKRDDGYIKTNSGNMVPRKTTKGWDLLVSWKDKSTSWVALKDIKESHPIEVAEYAVNNKIMEEPAFNWWVKAVLKKRDRIIMKVKSAYHRRTHKYGVRVPKTVQEAYKLDEENGDHQWRDAIEKEMSNVRVAFEFSDGDKVPIGYKEIPVHMVFDVKMMNLTRKARLVGGGHKTEPPKDAV